MSTRKDFAGTTARTRGDTWTIALPVVEPMAADGVEVSMSLRRDLDDPDSVYFVVTSATDAVEIGEQLARFSFSRGMTWLIAAPAVWYDVKTYDAATDQVLTHYHGRIEVLPTGDVDGAVTDPIIPFGTDARHGQRGGGDLHDLVVADGAAGFMSGADKAALDVLTSASAEVPQSRTLTAGAGLTGGGDLSADRAFAVGAHADGSIVVAADAVQVGILASDAQHGNRGGGALHADAVSNGASGFMTGAEKAKLASVAAGATVAPVLSVFGRVGAVLAAASDYAASLVSNDSAVSGATVKAALEALLPKAGGTLTGPIKSTPTAVAFSASPSFDLAVADDFALGAITSNFAITLANPAVGQSGEIAMVQNATGGWRITGITVAGFTVKLEGASLVLNSVEFKAASAHSLLAYRLCNIGGADICFVAVIPSVAPSYA